MIKKRDLKTSGYISSTTLILGFSKDANLDSHKADAKLLFSEMSDAMNLIKGCKTSGKAFVIDATSTENMNKNMQDLVRRFLLKVIEENGLKFTIITIKNGVFRKDVKDWRKIIIGRGAEGFAVGDIIIKEVEK